MRQEFIEVMLQEKQHKKKNQIENKEAMTQKNTCSDKGDGS